MDSCIKRALEEAEERYKIKVAKYPKEKLDSELEFILWEEAYREGLAAAYISSGGGKV